MTGELLVDSILTTSMISVAISLFAFSRYIVLKERLLEFIALAFLVGGFIRISGIITSDLGVFGGGQQAFSFQMAAWQGGRFLLGLMLAVGTLLVWIYPKPKSTLLDVLAGVGIAAVLVLLIASVAHVYEFKGSDFSSGNIRPLTLLVSGLFLIAFIGVSRNYLQYPTLFNYTISITLFILMLSGLVGSFSTSIADTASAAQVGLSVVAYTIGAVGSLVDIGQIFGEYVRSSEGLKTANQELLKYQLYLEKVPDPVRIVDETGKNLYVNPAFERDFGYTLSEIKGKSVLGLYDPGEREKVEQYARLVDQGVRNEFELTVVAKSGQKIETLLNSTSIVIGGKRLGRITVFRDITKRKELERRNQVLSAAVENTDEAIALTDAHGQVTFLNSAAEKLFGYTLADLPGRSLWAVVSPTFGYNKAREIYVQTVRGGSWKGEVLNQRKDGTEYYISLNASSIKDSGGNVIALVGICEDITEKKWAERRKEATYRVTQLAISSGKVRELAQSSVELFSEILNAPLAVLYFYDEKNMTLELVAQHNLQGRSASLPFIQRLELESDTDATHAAKTCKTVFSQSLSETEFSELDGEAFLRNAEGLISIPLVSSGELIGVVQYVSVATAGSTKYETELAEVAASELAVGIQRLRLGAKVAEQADQLEKIFASAAEGIALVDKRGKILLMNEGGKEILGINEIPEIGFSNYAETFGIQKLDGTRLDNDDNPVKLAAIDGKNIRNFEFVIMRYGVERVLSISASPLIDPGGSVNGAVVIFSDKTEQKKNELAIKKQNRRLSVINRTALAVKDALDVFEILNKSLTRLLEFEDVSAASVYLLKEGADTLELTASLGFGASFEKDQQIQKLSATDGLFADVLRRGDAEVISDVAAQSEEFFKVLYRELMSSAVIVPIIGTRKPHGIMVIAAKEKTNFTPTDTEFFMMISRVVGAAVENAFLYSDILEKSNELEDSNEQLRMSKIWIEEANAELVQVNQQLEEASRLKSQFLANMSHELRTPLNSIIGFTNLILTDDAQPPTGDQKEGLEIVLRNAKNLLALINDILDLSKIEAGRLTISPEEFNIELVVKDALTTVEPLVGDKPVKLVSEIDPRISLLYSDSARIKQIILNLLSNAAKFTDSGHIKVIVKPLEENFVSLAVEDTGYGIPPEYLDVVFEEFRQVDGSNTRKHGGTGLGLAISRKLARMLGGDLTVQSEVGKGSTFTLTVPMVYRSLEKTGAQEKVGVPPAPTALSQTNNLVVCIDDDPEVLLLLKNHLVSEGFEFYGVSDSRNAVDAVRQYKPVLVTLDIMMPNKDGWQILQELKLDPELKDIPVVIHSVVENKALAISLGAESYLVKPVDAQKIISVIRGYTGTAGGEILVVDDNEDFTNFLRNLLEKSSFTIYTAQNGVEAIRFLHKMAPALVFLDLLMPEMDGFEVVEKMYEDEKLKEVPIVVLTAKEVTDEERGVLNSKIKAIVQKEGLTREIILREVNKFISKGSRQRSGQRKKWKSDKKS